jgi:sirohydrochlorin cobaltochelatase
VSVPERVIPAPERALKKWLAAGRSRIGEVAIAKNSEVGFSLTHRDDVGRDDLASHSRAEDAAELARFDDAGNYRPLKTAPNLRHGWRLTVESEKMLRIALDLFYPGRLDTFLAWEEKALVTTPLCETLARQTGMYRLAATISNEQADVLVGNFCRSDGGCLRTIFWARDREGALASTYLPGEKFQAQYDQTGRGEPVIPLLCQEACNLLVTAARNVVKADRSPTGGSESHPSR